MKIIFIAALLFSVLNTFAQDSTHYKTNIEPYIQAEIDKENNTVYCASFQMAWQNLRDSIIKNDIVLRKGPLYLNHLNAYDSEGIIDRNYLLVKSGIVHSNIEKEIDSELKLRFNRTFDLPSHIGENDLVTFSYFRKEVNFYSALSDEFDKDEILKFNNNQVNFFGLKYGWANPTYKKQLKIHDYLSDDDFIFQIGTEKNEDEVFFCKIEPKETLEKTYNSVMARVGLGRISYVEEFDQIRIPFINLRSIKHFTDIENKKILNKGFRKYKFGQAIQFIDFNLTDKGIALETLAYELAYESVMDVEKKLLFNKPFLIIMKQKNSEKPYFLLWVSNTELMQLL